MYQSYQFVSTIVSFCSVPQKTVSRGGKLYFAKQNDFFILNLKMVQIRTSKGPWLDTFYVLITRSRQLWAAVPTKMCHHYPMWDDRRGQLIQSAMYIYM